MFFRQIVDADLGCASYLLGDAGRAVVVDPGLDTDPILACAAEEDATIELVVETHVHADHVSGRARLRDRTGARVLLPAAAGVDPRAGTPIAAGDVLELGAVRIEAVGAPGHRPEHLALLVRDTDRSPAPCLLLAGDSLLVGDLARPDLAVDAESGARALHATVGRLARLDASVELWPGHVGGSLCGGPGLSAKRSSTLGYELASNDLLRDPDRERFTERLIADLPERPPTVAAVVARNRTAEPDAPGSVPDLDVRGLRRALASGAVLVDARPAAAYDRAHVPGSLSLALEGRGLGTRAGWLIEPGTPLVVVADRAAEARELARRLRAVGLGPVVGTAGGGAETLVEVAALTSCPPIAASQLPPERMLLDVRSLEEWRGGHAKGSVHVPFERLREELDDLPAAPLAVICASGKRAALAASWLRTRDRNARRVAGGVADVPALALAG